MKLAMARTDVAVFADDKFPSDGAFGAPADFHAAAAELGGVTLRAADMPGFLKSAGPRSVLFMGHAGCFPAMPESGYRAFLQAGGAIVWLGGPVFEKEMLATPTAPSNMAGAAESGPLAWTRIYEFDISDLGLSPRGVEPLADLDRAEPILAVRPEYAAWFGVAARFCAATQISQLVASGAGRRVALGDMVQGGSTYARNDLFAMVEPGGPWNLGGGRVVCCGVRPGRGWRAENLPDMLRGILRFLEADRSNALKAGLSVARLCVPRGTPLGVECRARAGKKMADPRVMVYTSDGKPVRELRLVSGTAVIPTGALEPGRYEARLFDGDADLGLVERWSLIASPGPARPRVEVARVNGYAAYRVNDELLPMQGYCGFPFPRIMETAVPGFRDAGFRVYHIRDALSSGWKGPGSFDWSAHDRLVEQTLREDPGALLFFRCGLTAPEWWVEEHPESGWQHEGGLTGRTQDRNPPKYMSYFDPVWRRETTEAMVSYIRHACGSWYRDQVIGVFYTYGGTGEWGEETKDGLLWVDRHPAFVQRFRDFLRRKYGSDDGLRRAWSRIAEVQAADLRINTGEYFRLTNPQHHLLDDLQADLAKAAEVGPLEIAKAEIPNFLRRRVARFGVFRDPAQVRDVLDFFECYSSGMVELHQELSGAFKRAGEGNLLVGTFCGYCFVGPYEVDGGIIHTPYPEFLDETRSLDVMCSPGFYYRCENPTGDKVERAVSNSFELHDRFYMLESDERTCLVKVPHNGWGTVEGDLYQTLNSLKRDWALCASRGIGQWWFDINPGMYDHPEIMALMGKLHTIHQRLLREPNPAAFGRELTRCTMIYMSRACWYMAAASNYFRRQPENYPQLHFSRFGIPWEVFFPEDLERMPPRRVYLFLNAFLLTREQRRVIERKLKRDGNILIWLYGSGVFDEDGYDIAKASEVTGFKLASLDEWRKQRIELANYSHPIGKALRPVSEGLRGYDLADFGSVVADDPAASPEQDRICPQIFVSPSDADATAIGLQEGTDRVAFAVKEFEGWTSVFASAAILPAPVLRAILAWKGVEVVTDGLDNLYTNGDLLALNSLSTGYKTLRFPGEFAIEDLMTGEVHRSRNREVKVWAPYRETFLGRISKT